MGFLSFNYLSILATLFSFPKQSNTSFVECNVFKSSHEPRNWFDAFDDYWSRHQFLSLELLMHRLELWGFSVEIVGCKILIPVCC